MAYTYTWANAEQTSLKREDENGNVSWVPTAAGNRDYDEFISSAATAAAYVAPPAPAVVPTAHDLLEARVAAIEADEVSDDATSSALLTLIASINQRLTTLENA